MSGLNGRVATRRMQYAMDCNVIEEEHIRHSAHGMLDPKDLLGTFWRPRAQAEFVDDTLKQM